MHFLPLSTNENISNNLTNFSKELTHQDLMMIDFFSKSFLLRTMHYIIHRYISVDKSFKKGLTLSVYVS